MKPKFTLPELIGLTTRPWIEVQNLLEQNTSLIQSNLIIQLVNDSHDPPRIKVIIAAWGKQKLSLGDTGPWMTKEEWLERMGKYNLARRGSDYNRSHEYTLFKKYVQLGIFEDDKNLFRVKVNNNTLEVLTKYKNKHYFYNG